MGSKLFAIARLTFKAALSEKLLQLASFFGIALILLTIALGALAPGANAKILADFGLGSIEAVTVFVAIALAAADLPRELERRTLYVVLSKPVGRSVLVAGKYLGYMAALTVLTLMMALLFFGIIAMFHLPLQWPFVLSIGFGLLETFILVGMALLFSLLTSGTLAALYTLVFFVLGHQTGVLRDYGYHVGGTLRIATGILYRVVPNLELLNLKNEVIYGILPSSLQLWGSLAYAICWILGLGGLSVLILRRKEL